ncbi:MAG: sulfurtransferase complex subunit TusD [Oceanobacter sp.]
MATFSLFVSSNPFSSQAHWQALDFVRTALAAGHSIQRVFFYSDAVLVASKLVQPPQGQITASSVWQELASAHDFPLQACIANSLRRGIVNEAESQRYELESANMCAGFELVGLGEMAEALHDSDRVVQF